MNKAEIVDNILQHLIELDQSTDLAKEDIVRAMCAITAKMMDSTGVSIHVNDVYTLSLTVHDA